MDNDLFNVFHKIEFKSLPIYFEYTGGLTPHFYHSMRKDHGNLKWSPPLGSHLTQK